MPDPRRTHYTYTEGLADTRLRPPMGGRRKRKRKRKKRTRKKKDEGERGRGRKREEERIKRDGVRSCW